MKFKHYNHPALSIPNVVDFYSNSVHPKDLINADNDRICKSLLVRTLIRVYSSYQALITNQWSEHGNKKHHSPTLCILKNKDRYANRYFFIKEN